MKGRDASPFASCDLTDERTAGDCRPYLEKAPSPKVDSNLEMPSKSQLGF